MAQTLNIKDLFDIYNLKENKVAADNGGDSLVEKAKMVQEKLASALEKEEVFVQEPGLSKEESIIIKIADL